MGDEGGLGSVSICTFVDGGGGGVKDGSKILSMSTSEPASLNCVWISKGMTIKYKKFKKY